MSLCNVGNPRDHPHACDKSQMGYFITDAFSLLQEMTEEFETCERDLKYTLERTNAEIPFFFTVASQFFVLGFST